LSRLDKRHEWVPALRKGSDIDRDTLQALGDHLKQHISFEAGPRVGRLLPQTFKSKGCDHSLDRTIEWLKANGRDVEKDTRWLKRNGGTCDCKVIMNIVWRLDDGGEY